MIRKILVISLSVSLLAVLFACKSEGTTDNEKADLVIKGNIYIGDENKTIVEALAIKNGIVMYCGSEDGVIEYTDSSTKFESLDDNQFAIPGIIDAHTHPTIALNKNNAKTKDEYITIIEEAQKLYSKLGYTAYTEAFINEKSDLTIYPKAEAYEELDNEGKLNCYVNGSFVINNVNNYLELLNTAFELRNKTRGGEFEVTDIKIFMDGDVESHSAYLTNDYSDAKGNNGEAGTEWKTKEDLDRLSDIVAKANAIGMPCHFHAVGDKASLNALHTIDNAAKIIGEDKVRDCRNIITHLQLVSEDAYSLFKKYDVIANVNPNCYKEKNKFNDIYVKYLGKERADNSYPVKSFLQDGIHTSFGTDYGVSTINKFTDCYHAFVTRKIITDDDSSLLNEKQKLSPVEALMIMSYGSAYQLKKEMDFGKLDVGKFANITVLNQNLFEIEESKVINTIVEKTMYKGKWVAEK